MPTFHLNLTECFLFLVCNPSESICTLLAVAAGQSHVSKELMNYDALNQEHLRLYRSRPPPSSFIQRALNKHHNNPVITSTVTVQQPHRLHQAEAEVILSFCLLI